MNNSALPRIGIIGGAGPMVGGIFFQKIIQILQDKYGCKKDEDFPYILLLSYPFADMLDELNEEKEATIRQQLQDCFQVLAKNEINVSLIACNTLHRFLDFAIPSEIGFINIIEATGLYLKEEGIGQSLVLGTTTSANCRLHRQWFDCSYPDAPLQKECQLLINKILAGKHSSEDAVHFVERLNDYASKVKGDIGLVLGCTEFSQFDEQYPLAFYGLDEKYKIVDPALIIAERICKQFINNKI